MQPAPQNIQLMSKHCVLSFKPHLRLEWRGQDGQSETEQPDHSASLGDYITPSNSDRIFGTHKVLETFLAESRKIHELHNELARQRVVHLEGFVARITQTSFVPRGTLA